MSKQLLVVDGYNVIRSSSRYRHLIEESPVYGSDVYVRARDALISDVAEFAHGTYRAVIVFDGFANADPERPKRTSAGVEIVFSPYGVEADSVIERLVTQEREHGGRVTVVTSDSVVQSTVFGEGVTRLSARMFDDESFALDDRLAEMSTSPRPSPAVHTTIAQRIPADVAAKLHEMSLPASRRNRRR